MVRLGLRNREIGREVAFLGCCCSASKVTFKDREERGTKQSFYQIRARISFDRRQDNGPHFATRKL